MQSPKKDNAINGSCDDSISKLSGPNVSNWLLDQVGADPLKEKDGHVNTVRNGLKDNDL